MEQEEERFRNERGRRTQRTGPTESTKQGSHGPTETEATKGPA